MAETVDPQKPQRVTQSSTLEGAKVSVSPDNRLHVEFRINELIKKLMPGGALSSSCGGCGGCMGCGH
jgi:hypothetical protein